MAAVSCDVHGSNAALILSIVFLIHGCSGERRSMLFSYKGANILDTRANKPAWELDTMELTHPRNDLRKVCKDVTMKLQNHSKDGHFSFSNANGTALIDIKDEGELQWSIQTTAGNQTIKLPSVHIDWVQVKCVHKGLCNNIVTTAIKHWRDKYEKEDEKEAEKMNKKIRLLARKMKTKMKKKMKHRRKKMEKMKKKMKKLRSRDSEHKFGVSLLFNADPAVAGCICYMDAMMVGLSRKQLYVETKPELKVIAHEGYELNGEDCGQDLFMASLTIKKAAQVCAAEVIPGCQGFSIKYHPPPDPNKKLSLEEFHFKCIDPTVPKKKKMGKQDRVNTSDLWTSYRVQGSSHRPYKLQYEPKGDDILKQNRKWCKETFRQDATSPLLKVSWLFK